MKRTFNTIGYLLLSTLFACNSGNNTAELDSDKAIVIVAKPDIQATKSKKIKLAILLDTSGSMSGLIEQAKNQLWEIVNQLAKAKDEDGNDPEIEIALYQYGNDGLSMTNGYVEEISGFTTELDEISEQLFALSTNGGSEFCGTVIQSSLNDLKWSDSKEDLQMIFIAGNEDFNQGNVTYQSACEMANSNNVVVNTVFCGDYNQGVNTFWKNGAQLGKGKYMNIDHDAKIVHIVSPYDDQIEQLNLKLNDTYIPYGQKGRSKKENQIIQDSNAMSYGLANSTKRAISKSSKVYSNKQWDLVDASSDESFDVKEIKEETMPEEMKGMSEEEKIEYIKGKKTERDNIKTEIQVLGKNRAQFVSQEKAKNSTSNSNNLNDAMIEAIVVQAEGKSFKFVE